MAEDKARTVLWYMTFIGFIVNYMIRINLNITIVDMIVHKSDLPSPQNNSESVHFIKRSDNYSSLTNSSTVGSNHSKPYSLERLFLDWTNIEYERNGFHWNERQQSNLLGSFFWLHWLLQLPGGILARKYGTKWIFGLANGIGSICCFFIPIMSFWGYEALLYLRVFQGLISGMAWPSMHVLTAKWIPPNERSKFVSAYLGSSVGIALFYPIFGYVIAWCSWEWVYFISGTVGTLWVVAWQFLVFDSPAQHPRISQSELRYIEKSLGESVQDSTSESTPWKQIITSRPVWMNVVGQWGGIWGLFTLMTQAPTYFGLIHHWNIRATGLLSGMPHMVRMIFAYGYSMFSDYLLCTELLNRTNVRKLATAVACGATGVMTLALAYYGHNSTAAIVFVTLSTMFQGAVTAGPLASMVDLSPNYAGIILGVSGMIGCMPGFISPYIVGILTEGNQTIEAWKQVFNISAFMLIGSSILYVLFSESTLQSWNSGGSKLPDASRIESQLMEEKLPLQESEEYAPPKVKLNNSD